MGFTRREWLRVAGGAAGAGLVAHDVGEIGEAQAATPLEHGAGVKEFTTACNFCSCGCGMVARTRDGELLSLEGDPDHVINQGALCSKGAAMMVTHTSERRLRRPMYRPAGGDRWQEISWDEALAKLAAKLTQVRRDHWIAKQRDGDAEYAVNRTDAIALLGGAQNTNEECYLWNKMGRLLGTNYVEHQARL
jgi:formate dehydrogenase major subunit